jgi:hypothetical protein
MCRAPSPTSNARRRHFSGLPKTHTPQQSIAPRISYFSNTLEYLCTKGARRVEYAPLVATTEDGSTHEEYQDNLKQFESLIPSIGPNKCPRYRYVIIFNGLKVSQNPSMCQNSCSTVCGYPLDFLRVRH